jgi:hypothetical protein
MKPKRIQRKRTKGWRMPPGAVSVCRPGKHGNPFRIGDYALIGDPGGHSGPFRMAWCVTSKEHADSRYTHVKDAAMAVDLYRQMRRAVPLTPEQISELRGHDLACWCPIGSPCHADVLLEIANA